jgi:mevalonate kinase
MTANDKCVRASAPGKVIVIGEHFVVHGAYAIAAAVNKRARVSVSKGEEDQSVIISEGRKIKLTDEQGRLSAAGAVAARIFEEYGTPSESISIQIDSEIPPGSGLGSSAAISVASAAALGRFIGHDLDKEAISAIAAAGEKSVHGNPSGIDTQASLLGGMILFSRESGAKQIPLNRGIQLLVVYSGQERKTSELIAMVTKKREAFPSTFEHLSDAFSFASLQLVDALSNGDLPYLGAMMNLAQASLFWVGCSTTALEDLIENVLRDRSCFGAKLTGAGGGGSVIALPKPDRAEEVLSRISKRYSYSFIASIPQEGLRWE